MKYPNLRTLSPSADLGQRDDAAMKQAFPHSFKNMGKELVSSKYLRYKKAAVATDENSADGHSMQSISAPVEGFHQKSPSKFAAHVIGHEGVMASGDGHLKSVRPNMKMSNLEGSGGVSARSSKYAAHVVTAPGHPAIATKEETFGGVLKNKKVRNV